jgi:hypothetical protein
VTLPAIFVVLYVCHQVGDYLVQTDWQARNKAGGLGADPVARRALFAHVTTYTLAFAPALAWIGVERTAAIAFAAAVLVFLPHLLVDDGRIVRAYMRRVKGCREPLNASVSGGVDQALHLVFLAGIAVLASS